MIANINPEAICCDLHGRNCEPPSELCCHSCTEAAHPAHADGSTCSNPDLSPHRWDGTAKGATPVIDWLLRNGATARYHDDRDMPGVVTAVVVDTPEGPDASVAYLPGEFVQFPAGVR